ncbi:hypothetical protein SLE2022_098630 [Rubroshorea leprosula]
MEQSPDVPTGDEIEVAKILAEMSHIILESESSRPRFPFSWGVKKKRSVPGKDDAPTPSFPPAKSSPPPPPQPAAAKAASPAVPGTLLVVPPTKKAEASSPATPLSFWPSESDEKPEPHKKKVSLKRSREEQLQLIDALTRRKELLQREVENVRIYYKKIKAYNLALKARKEELISPGVEKEAFHVETKYAQPAANHHRQQPSLLFHQQPFIINRTAQTAQTSEESDNNCQFRHGHTCLLEGVRDKVGPARIPDLNVSPEEEEYSEPVDLNRARAAQARLKRKKICKMKNSTSSYKPRAING